jgi:hypothetical protein
MDKPYGAIDGNDRTLAIAAKFIITNEKTPKVPLLFPLTCF